MRFFVKPKRGRIVRDPRSRLPLPAEGKEVPGSSFWVRRIEAGDVELAGRKSVEKKIEKPISTKEKDK